MGFLNPWMLIGLAAAGIPVLVHLVFQRKAKLMRFPSIVFLRQLDKEVVRRRRLEQILVMLLRIAVLALFTLFIAKPFLSSRLFASGASKAVVIVFDDSYSMHVVEGKPLHDKAKERVLDLIGTLDRSDKVGFLTRAASPATRSTTARSRRTTPRCAPRRGARPRLRHGAPQRRDHARARPAARLEGAEPRDRRRERPAAPLVAELSIPEADESITFLVVNVAAPAAPVNAAVADLDILTTPDRELSRTFTFRAALKNFSATEFRGRFALAPLTGRSIEEGRARSAPRARSRA